jgi:hypothetical protein
MIEMAMNQNISKPNIPTLHCFEALHGAASGAVTPFTSTN